MNTLDTPPSPISLAHYRQLLAGEPMPTSAQIHAFVDYVCEARSWYKHLPLFPPGLVFNFYLDPFAGRDLRVTTDGKMVWEERTAEGIHYALLPTETYRTEFACLSCTHCYSHSVSYDKGADSSIEPPAGALVMDREAKAYALPPEIEMAGAVALTAAVHPASSSPMRSLYVRSDRWDADAARWCWPEETGGRKTLDEIVTLSKVPPTNALRFTDTQLDALIRPERDRQRNLMIQAIRRVCAVVGNSDELRGYTRNVDS